MSESLDGNIIPENIIPKEEKISEINQNLNNLQQTGTSEDIKNFLLSSDFKIVLKENISLLNLITQKCIEFSLLNILIQQMDKADIVSLLNLIGLNEFNIFLEKIIIDDRFSHLVKFKELILNNKGILKIPKENTKIINNLELLAQKSADIDESLLSPEVVKSVGLELNDMMEINKYLDDFNVLDCFDIYEEKDFNTLYEIIGNKKDVNIQFDCYKTILIKILTSGEDNLKKFVLGLPNDSKLKIYLTDDFFLNNITFLPSIIEKSLNLESFEIIINKLKGNPDLCELFMGGGSMLKTSEKINNLPNEKKKELFISYFNIFSECSEKNKNYYEYFTNFNDLYKGGYIDNNEKDQIEIATNLSTKDLIKLLSKGFNGNGFNITNKVLVWALIGNQQEKIVGRTRDDINQNIILLEGDEKIEFLGTLIERDRYDIIHDHLEPEIVKLLINDYTEYLSLQDPEIILTTGNERLFKHKIIGEEFRKSLIEKININNSDGKNKIVFMAIYPGLFDKYIGNEFIQNNIQKIEEVKEEIKKASKFDVKDIVFKKMFKSISIFVYDKNAGDNPGKDELMQKNDYNSTMKALLGAGYKKTKENSGSVQFSKKVNGITIIHELVISRDNANKDFTHYLEQTEKIKGKSFFKYDQIVIRGHCWSNASAILGSDKKNTKEREDPYNRNGSLILINGGCGQEANIPKFSKLLGNNVFQVATSKTGMGLINIPIQIKYPEEIAGKIGQENGFVDMKKVDGSIKELYVFKKGDTFFQGEQTGYTLTTGGSRITQKISSI